MLATLLLLALSQTPVASQNTSIGWDYLDSNLTADLVTGFLVCIDGQVTSSCTTVPLSNGVVTTAGTHTYSFKFPALTAGTHNVAIQACTVSNSQCSPGATLPFTMQIVIADPFNLRLIK